MGFFSLNIISVVLTSMLVGAGDGGTGPAPKRIDLHDYQWQKRIVLLFAPSTDDATYQRQQQLFNDVSAGLVDRDLVVGAVLGRDGGTFDNAMIESQSAATLRATFGVPDDGFMALLIGKDGTVKIRSSEPIAPDELFATIDAMPMRRQEMQRAANKR